MANSYLDIGDNPIIFPFEPNWASRPDTELAVTRYFVQHKGGSTLLLQQNAETPIAFSADFLIRNRSQSFQLLSFIHERVGRSYNFWVKYPKTLFTLAFNASSGATSITVLGNNFYLQGLGFERIFIEMNNGDILTRHITSNVHNEALDTTLLNLASPLDRVVTTTNHMMIGRFLLCRFDIDDFNLRLESDLVYSTRLKFYELVKEYPTV
jgi:hypothetical protein